MRSLHKKKRMARGIRHRRVRARVQGAHARPRLSVFRSNEHMYAQLIDDTAGVTLVHAWDGDIMNEANMRPIDAARKVGTILAERARAKGIEQAVFDRGGYAYHGRVAAVADGAREGGLEF